MLKMIMRNSLKRSFVAFAVRTRFQGGSISCSGVTKSVFSNSHAITTALPNTPHRPGGYISTVSTAFDITRLFSTFQPPTPPGTHGTPVFPDVDFSVFEDQSSHGSRRRIDPDAVFVVTGASRGIGLQFVKTLLNEYKGTIVACCRTPHNAEKLLQLRASLSDPSQIHLVTLDLEDQDSIESAGEEIRTKYNRVDVLLNVAGLLGDTKTTAGPERSLSKIDRKWFEKTLSINLVGPVMLSKELSSLLMQKSRRQQSNTPENDDGRPVSVVANLSARVGSISDNGLGGWYSYRISKSALNQATRTMALELKRSSVWCVSLHPGTTDTDLSKPFRANVKEGSLFPVEFTVSQLLKVIDSLSEEHSGGFYDWAGQSLSF